MSKLKAVIFDADGTLFNSKELIYAAYAHVARSHGLPVPMAEQINEHMGKPVRDILAGLFPGADIELLYTTNDAYVHENAATAAAYAGLEDMLRTLQRRGLRLGILTSGGTKIHKLLAHHGLDKFFASVVHGERVQSHKPEPEGFLLAAKECSVQPETAVMVGDMPVDIEVGKRAGALATIGVTHGFGSPESLQAAGADYLAQNLQEVQRIILKI